jgi:hypothetical protein
VRFAFELVLAAVPVDHMDDGRWSAIDDRCGLGCGDGRGRGSRHRDRRRAPPKLGADLGLGPVECPCLADELCRPDARPASLLSQVLAAKSCEAAGDHSYREGQRDEECVCPFHAGHRTKQTATAGLTRFQHSTKNR